MPAFEFQQPFDGTQPEVSRAEQEAVRIAFDNIVSDALLNNIEYVEASPLSGNIDSEWLNLVGPAGYPDAGIIITRDEQSEGVRAQILIRKGNGEHTDYMADTETGGVVRYDSDLPSGVPLDDEQKVGTDADVPEFPDTEGEETVEGDEEERDDNEVFAQNMENYFKYLENERANQGLEKSMGVNQQPVSLAEIEKVGELVRSAKYPYEQ